MTTRGPYVKRQPGETDSKHLPAPYRAHARNGAKAGTTAAGRKRIVYKLTEPQRTVFKSKARFRVLIAGRRFGKTHLACLELLTAAWGAANANRVCWYVAPTYRQAKEIAWKKLKEIVPAEYVLKSNETELKITLLNGSEIALKGADNPDSLRGVGLDFLVVDEFAFIAEAAWSEVLRPACADKQARVLFISTPAGYNWAYDCYLKGQPATEYWESWQFTTMEGGNVPAAEIEQARSEYDPRKFRQEFEASFELLAGRVYENFDREQNIDPTITDVGGRLYIGMDFNINPMTYVVGVKAADELHILDAVEVLTSNTSEVARDIRKRYPNRRITVCPDATGKARKTSAETGVTDFTILKEEGFEVDAPDANPDVADRVNAVNTALCDATGRRRLKLHPKATLLRRALDGQTYKEGTSIPDKLNGLDHPNDACGYLVWQTLNLLKPSRRARVSDFSPI